MYLFQYSEIAGGKNTFPSNKETKEYQQNWNWTILIITNPTRLDKSCSFIGRKDAQTNCSTMDGNNHTLLLPTVSLLLSFWPSFPEY